MSTKIRSRERSKDSDPIDFVVPWVDGADPEWLTERESFSPLAQPFDLGSDSRYRDWDLMRFWFRGVELYAPWVRKVHFVTWGHIPQWLNVENPKLHVVKHEDFIPEQYLPTFSSHVIELNMHRIEGLSERFVYFNDDIFLLRDLKREDFFLANEPRDIAALNVHCYSLEKTIQMIATRDTGVINSHFDKNVVLKENLLKWFSVKYGSNLLRTLLLMPWPRFPGFFMPHGPQSLLKTTLQEVWQAEPEVLNETCLHRFRTETDVNQWVFRCWQIAKGNFVPRSSKFTKLYMLQDVDRREKVLEAEKCIRQRRYPSVCINDGEMSHEEFSYSKDLIRRAFEKILPNNSSFEKDTRSLL